MVEFDAVDETNLQRQILFGEPDIGRAKLDVAAERLAGINSHVRIERHPARFDLDNALELVGAYDLVVDGSDNFPTRYLVNDACVLAGKPDVWGAVYRFEGQLSIFAAPGGPCYRCLFPEPPPPGLVPSCAEAGVLGVLPGVIGTLQATEAIKWIAGVGETLVGRLLLFDALALGFREVRVAKSADCPICSERPTQLGLVRYDDSCAPADAEIEIGAEELARRLAAGEPLEVVDVRLDHEVRIAPFPGARWLPLHELEARVEELPRDRTLVMVCHVGQRSAMAADFLRQRGFPRALNLAGGIDAWSRAVDPAVARY